MDSNVVKSQNLLLADALTAVTNEPDLAVKGGIAINYFYRDFPRYSVDLDLTFMPIRPRDETLKAIGDSLGRIKSEIEQRNESVLVETVVTPETKHPIALEMKQGAAKSRVEVNYVLRGSVYPNEQRAIVKPAGEELGTNVTASTLSFEDTFGGKLCAALSRQHPRDFFDLKILLENEGITRKTTTAFLVYLSSSNRPIHELLSPSPIDISERFRDEFIGLNRIPITLAELEQTRKKLVPAVHQALTTNDKEFLVSLSNAAPRWEMLDVPHAKDLPGMKWKLMNLEKMDKEKRRHQAKELEKVFSGKKKENGIER